MIERISFYGTGSIGVFCLATDNYVILPPDLPEKTVKTVSSILKVKVVSAKISSSILVGVFAVGNSNGLLLPYFCPQEDIQYLKSTLHINVDYLPSKKTALGNIILANDKAAIINPKLESSVKRHVEDILGVEAVATSIAGFEVVGAAATATNKGCIVHPMATEEELKNISEILKVKVDVGTVNAGFPFVGIGLVANSHGALVGNSTTGPELAHIEYSLGLVGE
ncbi:MAG: translation initiation factor IF-6 [archaeon GB-1867-097]|nr:translation initiation factor IF-6 [Candidatus Verstraetearchaeota archaeon]MCS7373749.1 translation initiation factor IF-6 [Candidatus Culexmicrobium thermophilum]MCS7384950.1 translation initiation factor IF-6 [Candidatus Culexmicrobium thermophilum]